MAASHLSAPRRAQARLSAQVPEFRDRVGWAYTARPGRSRAEVLADLTRMRDLGLNTVYVSHNNPGNADPNGIEPGMAPAVWYAMTRGTAHATGASLIYRAVVQTLEAAQQVGLDVVLAIGYQIQMGEEWNAEHPNELRRDRDQRLLSHWGSGETASPYSAVYRRDMDEYYAWVDAHLVRRFPNIVALNLADEPMGADLSSHAMLAFEARYGRPFDDATAHERGEFLAGVIADYASWSANRWAALNPNLRTMMTFHIQRDAPFLPDVERIFAQTPNQFVFSADTHLDDGPLDRQVTVAQTNLLYGMTRTLGWLSRVYDRPLMLWTSANAWGLKPSGTVTDALYNLDIVHDVSRHVGGRLGMLMAWGWNIRGQGVYDDGGVFPVDKDLMIESVSSALAERRDQLSTPGSALPERVVYVPNTVLFSAIGERRYTHLADGVIDLTGIDFIGRNAIYLTDGHALIEARRLGVPIEPL